MGCMEIYGFLLQQCISLMKCIHAEHIRTVKKPFLSAQKAEFKVNFSWRQCQIFCYVCELKNTEHRWSTIKITIVTNHML